MSDPQEQKASNIPANENTPGAAVSPLTPDFEQAHDAPLTVAEDEDPAAASAHAQKLQDEQAARAAAQEEETAEDAPQSAAHAAAAQQAYMIRQKCGHGVYDTGDEIHLCVKRGKQMTPQQMQDAVKAAMAKGWTEIHIFKADGTPDIGKAMQMQQIIIQMGVADKIKCCTNPAEQSPHIDQFKAACSGAAKVAVATAAVAGAAALAQQMIPR